MTDRQIRRFITLISILFTGCFIVSKSYAGMQFALPSKFTTKSPLTYPKSVPVSEDPVIIIPDVGRAMQLKKPHTPKTQNQYFISSKSGHLENGILTLSKAPIVGHFPIAMNAPTSALLPMQFVDRWQTLVASNENVAPESVLSIYTRKGTNNILLRLSNPRINRGTLSFAAKVMTGEPPTDFKLSTLFIRTDVEAQPTVSAFNPTPIEPVMEETIEPIIEETTDITEKAEAIETPEIIATNTMTDKYSHVYVLTSKSGRFSNGKLTLENIPTALLYQKDNNTHEALDIFSVESGLTSEKPTIGSLILYTQTSANRVLISLSNMTLEKNNLSFDADILKGELPENFRLSTTFFTMP